MSFMGTVGSVAQAAYAAVAPTNVSIATTSSGNYDDAFIVYSISLGSSGEDALVSNNGSGFSGNTAGINFVYDNNYLEQLNNNSGLLHFGVKGYIRATGATSFLWDINSYVLTATAGIINTSTSGIAGTASTSQDGTAGIGEGIRLYHTSGGRGYTQMQVGDTVSWEVDASATNGGLTTNATTCDVTITVIS